MNDEFYIGYVANAPRGIAASIRRIVILLVLSGLAIGAALTVKQPRFAESTFEYGVYRDYSGVIEDWPYPILRTRDTNYLLVAPGKHGLPVGRIAGKSVQLRGSLIERDRNRMLEVLPESIRETPSSALLPLETVTLGHFTLRGEIVDSKCYLGVMNPGSGKVHRDCAARCISGGAPPAFVVNDADGETRVLLLVGSDGRKLNREVLPLVAESLEIPGDLVRSGDMLVLKAEPKQFRRYAE